MVEPKSRAITKVPQKPRTTYSAFLTGKTPILFTAPHSAQLWRGETTGERERVHLRESFTSVLAIRWAKESQGSFIAWNKGKRLNETDVDPNYLTDKFLQDHPFHLGLHQWA